MKIFVSDTSVFICLKRYCAASMIKQRKSIAEETMSVSSCGRKESQM